MQNPEAQVHRKKAGGFRGQLFSEGREKEVSYILYDIWNIKYLTKLACFVAAYKSAIREQKLNMVLSASKREDFYLSKIEKSRGMTEIDEEAEESGSNAEAAPVFPSRVIRQFRQKKSINNETSQRKHGLSTDVLASLSIWRFLKRLRRSM
ncbi:hypothetical protein HID58_060865 [Brassica napus]|uniref:Uncharacterized protein n=2 Tax=Brassica napus TaxID=3708 RepID=A0ABQ7ZX21_BRANA|nr:hypothetical protein HID58_060865 [Brassica napus]